ncbi:DNA topoisomerase [Paenibacillus sp. FSL P2-0536]|uniref:DNA topoisomerase n=1 Tax=Paenibacillus sp. FSL P2-0536 TaxID=2921629 RepID=UPI0030FD1EE4
MYNRVILAEKPDMGENIAKVLGIASKKRGHIILQNGDVVTWAIGHLIHLKTPDAYPEYKEWKWDALPIIPHTMETEVDPKKKEQFETVKGLINQSKEVVLATDPEREGEYIGRLILKQCGFNRNFKRLWIDDLTEQTILAGMNNLRNSEELDTLGDAARARSYADYWLGFTASRFFSLVAQDATGGKANLSAGRVQTPTLRLVYDRELAIDQFQSKPFYTLNVEFHNEKGIYKGQWFSETKNRFEVIDQAEAMKKKIIGQFGEVTRFTSKEIKRQAPQLLNTSALKTASRKQLGFSTVRTTDVLQELYDAGFVSYPRVDSRHLSENKADELAKHLKSLKETSANAALFPESIGSLKGNTHFVDNKKAATHHAIVPTAKDPGQQEKPLTVDQIKLYELILRHTLAAHYPDGVDRETEILTTVSGETFISRATSILTPGWRELLKPDAEEQPEEDIASIKQLPILDQGSRSKANLAELGKGKTSKPKRLNDDELEKLMENAGKFVDDTVDEEILLQIKDKGIGTPATRTNIVQGLVGKEYIEITKNLVYLTKKGRSFMEMVYDHPIASIELTGEFEMKLAEVERGERPVADLLNEFRQLTHDILASKDKMVLKVKTLTGDHAFDNLEEIGVCPSCGKPVIEYPKIFSCSGRKEGCSFAIWKNFRGVTIKTKQASDLLLNKEILLKNIPGKESKPAYDMYLKIKDGAISTRFPTTEDQSLGACPTCGKPVVEGNKGFGCSGWREGCKFTIWKSFRNTELTAKMAKDLLKGKQIEIKDLPSEKGPYSLILKLTNGKVESRTPQAADKSLGECPICKSSVVENSNVYSCSKVGCKLKLSKNLLGVEVSAAQIRKLLKKGKTDKLEGFKGGKNGSFDTALGYDMENNRYAFVK